MAAVEPKTITSNSEAYEWDNEVRRLANNFCVSEATIVVQIGEGDNAKTIQVERRLLLNHLPGLRESMTDSRVIIQDDAQDFQDFLWFIHADPLDIIRYTKDCPAHERFRRALGIGLVSRTYNSNDITRWAIDELTEHMNTIQARRHKMRLHRFAKDSQSLSSALYARVLKTWYPDIRMSSDPVATLLTMKSMGDENLQAYAYYCILRRRRDSIPRELRLTALDRVRLALGSANLPPNPCACNYGWLIFATCERCIHGTYGGRSLWEIFTHSVIGISLADNSLDLSFLAVPSPTKHETVPAAEPA